MLLVLPCLSLPSLPCATKPSLSSAWLPMKSYLSTAIYDTKSGRIVKKVSFQKNNGHSIKNLTSPRIIARSFRFERVGLTNWVKTQDSRRKFVFDKKKKIQKHESQILYIVVLSVKKLPCPSSICPCPSCPAFRSLACLAPPNPSSSRPGYR